MLLFTSDDRKLSLLLYLKKPKKTKQGEQLQNASERVVDGPADYIMYHSTSTETQHHPPTSLTSHCLIHDSEVVGAPIN